MTNFLLIFIALSIINVIFSTIRSITTIKSGKVVASLVSGGYFSFYNVVIIFTVADFPMWEKCLITGLCNVMGVFIVKLIEEKMQKEKLWKIECTIHDEKVEELIDFLTKADLSFNYNMNYGKHTVFNIYCEKKEQSRVVRDILKLFDAKFFVTESKTL